MSCWTTIACIDISGHVRITVQVADKLTNATTTTPEAFATLTRDLAAISRGIQKITSTPPEARG